MKEALLKVWKFCLKAGLFFVFFSVLLTVVLRFLPVAWTPLMFIRVAQNAGEANNGIKHEWVSASQIPNNLQLAVVCTEDQNYLKHHGFDFEQIQHAMDIAEAGGRSRGASTISQQTAKNVFLWPTSSWVRKGFEVWFTVLIETFWSKERIMEVYLNSIEFGNGIYGCEAASQYYFKKSAIRLSNAEAARLAVVLPNPRKFKANAAAGYVVRRQNWALQQMGFWGGTLNYHPEEKEVKPPKKRKSKTNPSADSTSE